MAYTGLLSSRIKPVKIKLETTPGTEVTGDTDLLCYEPEFNPTGDWIERPGAGKYLGHTLPGCVGLYTGATSLRTELRGNGSQGMDGALAILLQIAGFSKSSETYTVHSTLANQKAASLDQHVDGVIKTIYGAMANLQLEGEVGQPVFATFDCMGVWKAPADLAVPAYSPGTRAPMILRNATLTLNSVALKVSRFSLNMNNAVEMRPDAGSAGGVLAAIIGNFAPELTLDPELDSIANWDVYGGWLAGTEWAFSLALTDGTDTITISCPKVQCKNIAEATRQNLAVVDWTGQCNMSTGNDAVSLAVT